MAENTLKQKSEVAGSRFLGDVLEFQIVFVLCGQLAWLTRALVRTPPSNEPVSPGEGHHHGDGHSLCRSDLWARLSAHDAREAAGSGGTCTHTHTQTGCMLSLQEPVVSEEVELIVESLLGVLLRTILEISNRPQPAGPPMRLQVQDVTVSVCGVCVWCE